MCKSWIVPSQYVCMWCIWVAAYAQRRCCRSVYMSKDYVMFLQCMWLNACKWIRKSLNQSIYCVILMCMCAKAESCLHNIYVYDVCELQHVRKDVAVILCIWAKTVLYLCSVCDCDACKSIWLSEKLINLLHHASV